MEYWEQKSEDEEECSAEKKSGVEGVCSAAEESGVEGVCSTAKKSGVEVVCSAEEEFEEEAACLAETRFWEEVVFLVEEGSAASSLVVWVLQSLAWALLLVASVSPSEAWGRAHRFSYSLFLCTNLCGNNFST